MSFALEFLPEAGTEIEEAVRYYTRLHAPLGARFRQLFESVVEDVTNNPLLARERRGAYRRVNLTGFPYYIAYIIRGSCVIIVAAGHAAREPEYWLPRVP